MQNLAAFRRVDYLTTEHVTNGLCDTSLTGEFAEHLQALPVNLSVRVVEPDAVEKFEAQSIVASLIL